MKQSLSHTLKLNTLTQLNTCYWMLKICPITLKCWKGTVHNVFEIVPIRYYLYSQLFTYYNYSLIYKSLYQYSFTICLLSLAIPGIKQRRSYKTELKLFNRVGLENVAVVKACALLTVLRRILGIGKKKGIQIILRPNKSHFNNSSTHHWFR